MPPRVLVLLLILPALASGLVFTLHNPFFPVEHGLRLLHAPPLRVATARPLHQNNDTICLRFEARPVVGPLLDVTLYTAKDRNQSSMHVMALDRSVYFVHMAISPRPGAGYIINGIVRTSRNFLWAAPLLLMAFDPLGIAHDSIRRYKRAVMRAKN